MHSHDKNIRAHGMVITVPLLLLSGVRQRLVCGGERLILGYNVIETRSVQSANTEGIKAHLEPDGNQT